MPSGMTSGTLCVHSGGLSQASRRSLSFLAAVAMAMAFCRRSWLCGSSIPFLMSALDWAGEENAEIFLTLLKTNDLPVSDLNMGQRIFLVALSNGKTVGCVAVEIYGDAGILRSLAVNNDYRGKGIGQKLVVEAESWSRDNGLKNLYLLTTTAAGFFPKMGWENTERISVPEGIAKSIEFASICPSIAVCMHKTII